MDTFGIFREDSAPVLSVHKIANTLPSHIKGKARGLGIKKKALGDVSNIVTQKALNSKPGDTSGKPSETCFAKPQEDLTASCKQNVKVKEEVPSHVEDSDNFSTCKLCFDDFEYDVRHENEKLTKDQIKELTNIWTRSYSPPSSMNDLSLDSDLELPSQDTSFHMFMAPPLEFSPIVCSIPFCD